MSDPNLTAALRASLKVVESEGQGELSGESPLREATPDSIDALLDHINSAFAAGLPEQVSDEKLRQLVDIYRAQTLKWEQDEQARRDKPKGERKPRKSIAEALEIDLDL